MLLSLPFKNIVFLSLWEGSSMFVLLDHKSFWIRILTCPANSVQLEGVNSGAGFFFMLILNQLFGQWHWCSSNLQLMISMSLRGSVILSEYSNHLFSLRVTVFSICLETWTQLGDPKTVCGQDRPDSHWSFAKPKTQLWKIWAIKVKMQAWNEAHSQCFLN